MFSVQVKVNFSLDKHTPYKLKGILISDGVLISHLRYQVYKKANGLGSVWLNKSCCAVQLLIDYHMVNKDNFNNPYDLFSSFALRLQQGTIQDGTDPTWLMWDARSSNSVREIINHITQYSDWLNEQAVDRNGDGKAVLNPKRKASASERIVNLAAYNHKMNNAFLKHTYSRDHKEEAVGTSRYVKVSKRTSTYNLPKKFFDENKIWDLLTVGFFKRGASPNAEPQDKYNLSHVLITMLMHFGGLRASECFHLYIDDIITNRGARSIKVYHPKEGLAPRWYRDRQNMPYCNRSAFLEARYGLTPRTEGFSGSAYHAGWKDSLVQSDDKSFTVFLFDTDPRTIDIFYKYYERYLLIQRVEPKPDRQHPFLFTNKRGDPLSLSEFKKTHKKAVMKIGMSPYLSDGGTPHSHRHAYAQRLTDVKDIQKSSIKKALHHRSIDSQDIYTEPTDKKVQEQLALAENLHTSNVPDQALEVLKPGRD